MDSIPLYEKYRPRTLAEFVGNEKIAARIKAMMARGIGGTALTIRGASGTGKSTLARIIADVWTEGQGSAVWHYDGGSLNVDAARELQGRLQGRGLFGKRAVIVDEAHAIGGGKENGAIQVLLTLLERIPGDTVIIFTTTEDREDMFGNFSGPFASRSCPIKLSNQGLAEAFAERAREIAQKEGLDGQPIERYVALIKDCRNNMRAALERIRGCEMMA
jgi:replication-associated recombination protein RarA